MMELPKDPMMLFSVINMKLRDCYSSLDELCEEMSVSKEDIVNHLILELTKHLYDLNEA